MRRIVVVTLLLVLIGGTTYAWATGAVTPSSVFAWLESLGPWAPVVFVGAFLLGKMAGLPAMAFIVGARLAFGPWIGFACGYAGGLLAVTIPFALVRIGRRTDVPTWRPRWAWLAKVFETIETRPVRAVATLRLFVWFSQPAAYALAVTRVRLRDYVLGCAIAAVPVVGLGNLATGWFL